MMRRVRSLIWIIAAFFSYSHASIGGGSNNSYDIFHFDASKWVVGDACYRVIYSNEHLSIHPDQQVKDLFIRFRDDPDATVQSVEIGAMFRRATYFHAKKSGNAATNFNGWVFSWMPCTEAWSLDGALICSTNPDSIDTAGGFGVVDIDRNEDSILIETSVIGAIIGVDAWIGNENNCQQTGRPCNAVRYKLYKRNLSDCPDIR